MRKIKSALISVFDKNGLDKIINILIENNVKIYSTGGTLDFIKSLGHEAIAVESLTSYPSILGGRVKTLHPKVFGGILARRDNQTDIQQLSEYEIPEIDLVIVDLYPFEQTVLSGAEHSDIIEKIDIGGISLIRAAAKNYKDVVIIPSQSQYNELLDIISDHNCETTIEQRRYFAARAFQVSSHYDTAIFNYFNIEQKINTFKEDIIEEKALRYGENPHQKATFFGNIDSLFSQFNGKEISYNNMLDIDAAIHLIHEFTEPTIAILKHNNACGVASRTTIVDAWKDALAGDPVSAFGGVIISNRTIDKIAADEINSLFFEVIIAPEYDIDALEVLKSKKNRIILKQNQYTPSSTTFRSLLNGVAVQDRDTIVGGRDNEMKLVTKKQIESDRKADLIFANILVKHSKSNSIVLVKDGMMLASGVGQTSRVDALRQAIEKANSFGFDLNGAVLASDAFFPFADCVEIAHKSGINTFIQPGGSIRDIDSIEYCNNNNLSMVFTGTRHFKH